MSNPEYVKVNDKLYKINTDFRIALECNKIAEDKSIGDTERALAIIYKLFGEDGLDCEDKNKLIELAIKYLSLGRDEKGLKNDFGGKYEPDFNKCIGLIKSSFKFDYGYDPYEMEYIHWYNFYNDLQNLSSSEFGTCCALNRILGIINMDTTGMKDKQASDLRKTQVYLRKMYCKGKDKELTKEEKESVANLYKQIGLWKGEE